MHGRELRPQRAADRSWRYSPDEIVAVAFGGSADGAVAARVFALFEKDVPLQKVPYRSYRLWRLFTINADTRGGYKDD